MNPFLMETQRKSNGFSLIEILIALVILSFSLLALAGLMSTTTRNISFGAHMTEAATMAQDRLERLRQSPMQYIPLAYNTQTVGQTGILYTISWVAVQNSTTLDTVTITVRWTDTTNHSISIGSVIAQ